MLNRSGDYFIYLYENTLMKPVEIVLIRGGER
jgi:hypothetical protein